MEQHNKDYLKGAVRDYSDREYIIITIGRKFDKKIPIHEYKQIRAFFKAFPGDNKIKDMYCERRSFFGNNEKDRLNGLSIKIKITKLPYRDVLQFFMNYLCLLKDVPIIKTDDEWHGWTVGNLMLDETYA